MCVVVTWKSGARLPFGLSKTVCQNWPFLDFFLWTNLPFWPVLKIEFGIFTLFDLATLRKIKFLPYGKKRPRLERSFPKGPIRTILCAKGLKKRLIAKEKFLQRNFFDEIFFLTIRTKHYFRVLTKGPFK